MVRVIVAASFAMLIAIPTMAQEDFPRVEISLGYANLGFNCCSNIVYEGFPCCGNILFAHKRHSGFASTQGLNLTRIFGIENYFGYYGLGGKNTLGANASLIVNTVGGKIAARTERAVPYFTAGIGVGYITGDYPFGQSSFAMRWGPGVDIKMNDLMAWKIDFSRMSFNENFTFSGRSWSSGWNVATGIVFVLSNRHRVASAGE